MSYDQWTYMDTSPSSFLVEFELVLRNLTTRGVLERDKQAATKALCLGMMCKAKPKRIPYTIMRTLMATLPIRATFQTCKRMLS